MAESPPDVAVSPEQGRVSPEQGQRGFRILREISLVCNGRAPTSGADDGRFVVPGGKGLPDVRLWPGVKIVRKVSVGQHVLEVVCSVQESADGPLFTCCVTDADDHFPFSSLQTVASSMTSAVRKLFQQLRVELGADEESSLEKNVKGPYFFGLRSAEFGIAHTLDATLFPGKDVDEPVCNCGMDNDEDARTFFVQENHGDAKVQWNGVVDVGRDCKCDEPDWKLVVGGVEIILRPGFTVTREVQTRAHGYVSVICKILERELSSRTIPLYECTADIGHGRRITTSSIVCRAAVRDILERVGAVTKHKWAQDFFGLSKSSVSTLLATSRHEDEPSNKRPRSAVRRVAPILVRLQNIQNRGSGPTSQLQNLSSRPE